MSSDKVQLSFKGPPNRLVGESVLRLAETGRPLVLELNGRRYRLGVRKAGSDGVSLRLRLPENTPSGTHAARVHAGEQSYDASVEVDEKPRFVVEPAEIHLAASPGRATVTTVRVRNAGNVARPLEGTQTVTFREAGAIGRGVRKAFGEESGDIASRLIELGRQLDSEPARQAEVGCKADFDSLEAGAEANVQVRVRLSDEWKGNPGSWSGQLSLLGASVGLTVDVAGKVPKKSNQDT